ncbi:hypothetical protein SAMN06265795_103152 [Noviherbaspirillum humi]|uniref:Uncharacterized protein n=1 Tax=Noviherbaspirillum humi TaxID=1688639 RepID=A0A239F3I9_9BURK|nr:hypothetical protein [Noviherbaspirillum humi]SNS51271.1 hypothetical protein SAMN06265795_103152 [Noviherbaspirillum humi]
MAYTAYLLTEESRRRILERFPPRFGDVACHHVTERFGVPPGKTRLPEPAEITVVGYACDASLEALVVTVNGRTQRPDGRVFHITLSLDRSLGRKPAQANEMIAASGWREVEPLPVDAVPRIL